MDFGGGQYLPIASRRMFWDRVRDERAIVVLWISLGLLILSIVLRYFEFSKIVVHKLPKDFQEE